MTTDQVARAHSGTGTGTGTGTGIGTETDANPPLKRNLSERQISLMAIGSAIGVGLFYGSASAIRLAGPGILIAYAVCGLFVLCAMRALGEMAVRNPVAGSFSRYAYEYLHPRIGFVTGLTYWFALMTGTMAEVTAVGVYMKFWFPESLPWVWALIALAAMGAINLIAARGFGELEFWFAGIKVVTIAVLIISGIGIITMGIGNGGVPTGISNLWSHGGFLPYGIAGVFAALPMVVFAYGGVEILGLTAGEAANPERALRKAVDSVFWRISIFYIGALFVIVSIYPWDELGTGGSPFVMIFERLGIRQAAGILNFVICTAALSSCNANIFGAGRMLYNLARQGQAPARLLFVSRLGVPVYAVLAGLIAIVTGMVLTSVTPREVFIILTSVATFSYLFTWSIIIIANLGFRRKTRDFQRLLPFAPYSSWATLGFLAAIAALMAASPDSRIALLVGPVWLALLWFAYPLAVREPQP